MSSSSIERMRLEVDFEEARATASFILLVDTRLSKSLAWVFVGLVLVAC